MKLAPGRWVDCNYRAYWEPDLPGKERKRAESGQGKKKERLEDEKRRPETISFDRYMRGDESVGEGLLSGDVARANRITKKGYGVTVFHQEGETRG